MNESIRVQGSYPSLPQDESEAKHFLRMALAQVLPSDEGIQAGDAMIKLKQYAQKAAESGADVVVFPEYFLTGATHDHWRQVRENEYPIGSPILPEDDDEDHWLNEVCSIAKEFDIDIVAGTVVELGGHHPPHRNESNSNHKDKLFNTARYISRQGEILGTYTKSNLWHPERETLSASHPSTHKSDKTFWIETKRGLKLRAGMLICWDLAFPEAFREMFDIDEKEEGGIIGPDVIFVPTCWYATDAGAKGLRWNKNSEASLLDGMVMSRSIESEAIIAMTNVAGPPWPKEALESDSPLASDALIGVGHTNVCAPFLGSIAKVESAEETLLLAQVDTRVLQDARNVYLVRKDLRLREMKA